MPGVIRPRPYISWSQLTVIEASDKTYCDRYFLGKKFNSPALSFGSVVAESLERGEATGDLNTDLILSGLPKLALADKEFRATIKVGGVDIPLLAKIDMASEDLAEFVELKTGVVPWTQARADSWGQITFYCVVAEVLTGKIPAKITLRWAQTAVGDDGAIFLTGFVKDFPTKRSAIDLLKMKNRIAKAWVRIGELTSEYLF